MTNSIPKTPVSMGYYRLRNAAMKDLMDIFKGTQSESLKNLNHVKNEGNKNTILENKYNQESIQTPVKQPPTDILIQTIKKIVDNYQINDRGNFYLNTNNISQELQEQHDSTIKFKGEFFDFLRNVLQQHTGDKATESAVVNVLRAYVTLTSKTKFQNILLENMGKLIENLSSQQVSEIKQMIQDNQFGNDFKKLLLLLKPIATGDNKSPDIMASMTKITEAYEKIQSLEGNKFSLHESLKNLLEALPDTELGKQFKEWNHKFEQLFLLQENQEQENPFTQPKTVIDKIIAAFINEGSKIEDEAHTLESILTKALTTNKSDLLATNQNENISESNNILEKILQELTDKSKQISDKEGINALTEAFLKGMTASQVSKHPLLHFLLPIKFEDIQAMSEIWIDPNDQENGEGKGNESSTHMFLTLNVEHIGNFELEILLTGKNIDIQLSCPTSTIERFEDSDSKISQIVQNSGFHLNRLDITQTKKNRQLNEIFPESFEKRMGVNAKA